MATVLFITPEPEQLQVNAGAPASAQVRLDNRSASDGEYLLQASGVPDSWVHLEPTRLGVPAGGTAQVRATITVPADALPALYTITLRALDAATEAEQALGTLAVRVTADAQAAEVAAAATAAATVAAADAALPPPAVGLVLEPEKAETTHTAHIVVKVTNPLNAPLTVHLSADPLKSAFDLQFSPTTVELGPHETAMVALVAAPFSDAPVEVRTAHAFQVRATPEGSTASTGEFIGQVVQLPPAAAEPAPAVPAAAVAAAVAATANPPVPPPAAPAHLPITLTPPSQAAVGAAVFGIAIANPHPRPLELTLTARDESNQLALVVQPTHLLIGSLEQGNARVQVTPTSPLLANEADRPCHFTIDAQSTEGDTGTVHGTLVVRRNAASPIPWVGIGLALGIVLLLLAYLFFTRNNSSSGGAVATATLFPTNAPPITVVITVPPPPTGLAPTNVPPTAVPPTGVPPTAVPPTAVPPTAVPPTPLPPFALTQLITTVQPSTASVCPTTFRFSTQINATGRGSATYFWEFSDGTRTDPAQVNFTNGGQAVVQVSRELTASQTGWGRVQVTAPAVAASNEAAYVLNCPAAPTAVPVEPSPTTEIAPTTTPEVATPIVQPTATP